MNWFLVMLPLSAIGGLWLLVKVAKEFSWIKDLIYDYSKAARDQKMMYEWAHKNQAWCSKNQLDLEALARRVVILEELCSPAKGET